jgi:hypothetical protein
MGQISGFIERDPRGELSGRKAGRRYLPSYTGDVAGQRGTSGAI